MYTGKRLHSYAWEELPVSDEIIERVEEIARQQQQPELVNEILSFEWASTHGVSEEPDKEEAEIEVNDSENKDSIIEEQNNNTQVTDDEKEVNNGK